MINVLFLEQVGGIEQGKFIENKNIMCYIACVYTTGQAVRPYSLYIN